MEVRRAIGISQSNLSDVEGGAEGSAFTAQLAHLYGCDGHWLATGFGEPRFAAVAREVASPYTSSKRKLEEDLRDIRSSNPETYDRLVESIGRIADGARETEKVIRPKTAAKGYVDPARAAKAYGKPPKGRDASSPHDSGLGGLDELTPSPKGRKR